MCVSLCRCCVLGYVVQPTEVLSAMFCGICSLLMFVSDTSGDHMVETYSSMSLVILGIVSCCFMFPVVSCWGCE